MKEVYLLRHGNWNLTEDALTEEGRKNAAQKAELLPKFKSVYSSPLNRTQQTANVLSGKQPTIDERASTPKAPSELGPIIAEKRRTNPFGVAGALFEIHEARPALQAAGKALSELVAQALNQLNDGEAALIVSHDGTMVAAEKEIKHEPFDVPLGHTYGELEGFVINEEMDIRRI